MHVHVREGPFNGVRAVGGSPYVRAMTNLAPSDYLEHLRTESRRFREVLADCEPTTRVPTCPDWDAGDLVWHLAGVQWFWSQRITHRPAPPSEDDPGPERPASYDGLLAAFDEHSAGLIAALEQADPAEEAWSWAPEQTVGFTFRRQAHEALIHRLDAELTAGAVTPLDARLAADGVAELLGVMFGGIPPWGTFTPTGQRIRVDITDTGDVLWVETGHFTGSDPDGGASYTDELAVEPCADPGSEPDVVIAGPAAALDAWLWHRGSDDEVTVTGDRAAYDVFREAVNHPID